MTLANILLFSQKKYQHLNITIEDENDVLYFIKPHLPLWVTLKKGANVSLLPLNDEVCGVTTEGLHYELYDDALAMGSSRGLSNVVSDPKVSISIKLAVFLASGPACM